MSQNGNKPVLGIDIGGTKIAGALISQNGEIFHKTQIPTPQTGPGNGFQQIASLIDQMNLIPMMANIIILNLFRRYWKN